MLQDMAILTGGQVISEEVGLKLENATLDLLGTAKRVIITKDNTTIVDGAGDERRRQGRINQIKAEIENTDSDWDREKLQERLAKLSGGVAVIKVGAATEVELKEKKHRIEDALSATRAAIEEGVVAGGGTALLRSPSVRQSVVKRLSGDEATGAQTVWNALEAPTRLIAENAGLSGEVLVRQVEGERARSASTRHRRVRGPGQGRRHRPGQGHPGCAAERGVDRRPRPHHRGLVADKPEKAARRPAGRRQGRHGRHGRDDVSPEGVNCPVMRPRRGTAACAQTGVVRGTLLDPPAGGVRARPGPSSPRPSRADRPSRPAPPRPTILVSGAGRRRLARPAGRPGSRPSTAPVDIVPAIVALVVAVLPWTAPTSPAGRSWRRRRPPRRCNPRATTPQARAAAAEAGRRRRGPRPLGRPVGGRAA